MSLFALLNRDTGNIDANQSVSSGVPATPFGNRVWIVDLPPTYDPTTQIIQVATPIAPDATTVPYNVLPMPLSQAIAAKLQALNAFALVRDSAGTTFSTIPVFTTDHYKILYAVYNQRAASGAQATFNLPDSNGTFHALNATQMQALYAAVATYVAAVINNQSTHATNISALSTVALVNAYDFTTGWP